MSKVRHWGSTAEERAEHFPCDDLIPDAEEQAFRAIDVAAPPAVVFRWLCQLRVAPYSYDWLDNLGRRSPRELSPGLDQLAVGQPVMVIFRLASFERDRHLTIAVRSRAWIRTLGEGAVTYRVTPAAGGSRLAVKIVARRPRAPFGLLSRLLPLGDFIMMRKQLLTLKKLAESSAVPGLPESRSPRRSA